MDDLREGLVEEYVLGLCSPSEEKLVEQAANEDPELAKLIDDLKKSLHHYCRSQEKKPPANLKAKIFKQISETPVKDSRNTVVSRLNKQRWWLVAACALLLLSVGFLANRVSRLEDQFARLDREYDRAITDRQLLTGEIEDLRSKFDFLHHEATHRIQLTGTNHAPEGLAIVYWNDVSQDAVIKFVALPPAPSGMIYQLWADVDGQMKSLGTMAEMGSWIQLPFMAEAESLNLTLEEGRGSEEPTVDKIYVRGII